MTDREQQAVQRNARNTAENTTYADKAAKAACRKAALAARDAIPPELRAQKSATICAELVRLTDSLFQQANITPHTRAIKATCKPTMAVYFPMKSEVDLGDFFFAAYKCGWRLAFPVMTDTGMAFYDIPVARFTEARDAFLSTPLRTMSRDRMHELGYCEAGATAIDLAVCPLVAFDNSNARLGYGGGNYDRFLPQLRANTPVIGVAFDEQRVCHVPTEPHDKPLQQIVHA
ncbi:5-formyltetrahydrofolate cyclo-ligase [Adlercreutzia sp. ZJ138]|uniref:5-formyltetrahydrofolate cyclo-ligase n=1 Tax=Adlercreutzia sp. ZJ138 TaxID=2709405 RepID=UPI0013ECE759|nr:5-formyltetrahydrofolate cyclo-ligase [Adlercreutzia sp. ZJ138]